MKRIVLLGAVLALALAGCGKKDRLVGTWESTSTKGATQTFNADGTYALSFEQAAGPQTLTIRSTGTYKVDQTGEKTASLTLTSKTVKIEGVPQQYRKQADDAAKQQEGKEQKVKAEFKTDDEVVITVDGAPGAMAAVTYKRKI